ncbi:MAG TPA: hypothetical protein DCX06_07445 [Opitutae bacterium]|nr:hypothetical protein [Opitutae bacterium]
MIKKILLVLVLLAVIAAAAVYFLGSAALNKGIKHGVETVGPQVTETSVTLADVNISVLSGKGTLKSLNVGNPDGFKSANIFALGQIDIEVDTSTVFSDKIVINKIHIRQPEISYEKKLTGSNVKKLLDSIEKFTGPKSDTPDDAPVEDSGAKKQIVIKQLIIEDGKVYVGALGVGQEVPLPRIEMKNIGEDGNETSIAEVLDVVLSKVLASIGPAIADAGQLLKGAGDDALKAVQESTTDKVGEAAGDALNKASEGIKGLFGN